MAGEGRVAFKGREGESGHDNHKLNTLPHTRNFLYGHYQLIPLINCNTSLLLLSTLGLGPG